MASGYPRERRAWLAFSIFHFPFSIAFPLPR
jgi:hypothetical protein